MFGFLWRRGDCYLRVVMVWVWGLEIWFLGEGKMKDRNEVKEISD